MIFADRRDLRERYVEDTIAPGLDDFNFDRLRVWKRAEPRRDVPGLREREIRTAAAYNDRSV